MAGKGQTDSNQALDIARMIGQPFPQTLLSAVLGDEEPVLDLLDSGKLVETEQAGYVRLADQEDEAVPVALLDRSEKRKLYGDLGKAAENLRLAEDMSARFYAMAQNHKKARRLWIRAAERACDRKSYSAALECMVKALEIWPWNESPADRVRILHEQARCAITAGEDSLAVAALQELSEYAEDNGKYELLVESLGRLAGLSGDTAAVTANFKKAASLAEEHLPPRRAVRVMLDYVDHLANRVRIGLAGEVMERVVSLAEQDELRDLLSEVRGWEGLIAAMAGKHERAESMIEESLRIAIENELPDQVALAYRRRANIAEYNGNYGKEITAHTEAIQYCRKVEVDGQTSCLSCLAYACFRTGDWKQALKSAKAVMDDNNAHPILKAIAECVEGLIASFRGERKAADKKLNHALSRLRVDGLLGMEFFVLMGLGFQAAMNDNEKEASRIYDEIRTLWRESEDLHDVIPALLFAGGHYAHAGHADRLADCIDILVTIMRKNPLEEAKGTLVALRGEQAFLEGRKDDFISAMEEAGSIYSRVGLPLERIWVMSSAACISGKSGMDAECTHLARRMGLRPILALFENSVPEKGESPCDLTPRQMEVLQMLAEGLTSKEMAVRLYLSPRTVEMHVGRLMDRLNCRTRPEAVRIATQNGWVARS